MVVVSSLLVVAVAGTVVWMVIRQRQQTGEDVAETVEESRDGQGQREAEPASSHRSVNVSA